MGLWDDQRGEREYYREDWIDLKLWKKKGSMFELRILLVVQKNPNK